MMTSILDPFPEQQTLSQLGFVFLSTLNFDSMKKFWVWSLLVLNIFQNCHGKLIEVLEHSHVDNLLEGALSDHCNSTSGTLPVVSLMNHIANTYLNDCFTTVLYDDYFYKSHKFNVIIEQLLKTYPYPSVHGRLLITGRSMKVKGDIIKKRREQKCNNFVLLTKELEMVSDVLGKQPESRIIIVPLTSLWQLSSFLTSPISQNLVNMLILFDPSLTVEGLEARNNSKDVTIYTHLLFTDSMGATLPKVMTVWRCNRLTQPKLNLFPNKFQSGFNGYRFRLSGAQQPPFVFRKKNQQSKSNADERITTWDGYEVRLLQLVSEALNFTFKIEEPADSGNASDRRVIKEVRNLRADIAIAGIPATADRMNEFSFSTVHSYDCANFITLTSTALPKYRAILGPFRLEVWICLILIYLFAIIPISFSARHTLKHLLEDPWEIENMFWYVFGTFTNCFTFVGRGSWTSGKHNATRLFIGTYWVFTIIITAAYTGCIIAFITLPAYPPVLDTAHQLLKANYRIGILNGSGWQAAFENSSDKVTDRLLKKADFVPNLALGLKNVSKAVYWRPYAFLGSKEEMKFMINTNYTPSSRHKKSLFHLSKECFVPLRVSAVFSKDAIYKHPLDVTIMRVIQSGLFMKLSRDVEWDQYRASTGKLMQVSSSNLKLGAPEDRQLTLDDTQGMFLLLGAGVLLAFVSFFTECAVAVRRRCKAWLHQRALDDVSTSRNVSVVLDAQTESVSDYLGILHSENRSQIEGSAALSKHPISLSLMSLEESISSHASARRFSL